MSRDRRCYGRFYVNIGAVLFGIQDIAEIRCKIKNISEQGIGFEVPASYEEFLSVGDDITFQFYDAFMYGNEEESAVICEKGRVKHIDRSGNSLFIGCYLNSEDYRRYVLHKEMSGVLLRLHENKVAAITAYA